MTIGSNDMDGMLESVGGSSQWLAITLSPEYQIKSISSRAANTLGYTPQELFHRPVTQILADDTAFELPQILDAAGKWGYWEGGLVYQSREGKPIEVIGALSTLLSQENQVAGYLLISSTGIMMSPDNGNDSRLAEVSACLRSICHELNNPLAVMMGFTQLLTMNAACPAKIRADIDRVYSELKQVIDVVERLHDYALALCKKAQPYPSGPRVAETSPASQSLASPSAAGSLHEP
jgi:signal transduction histidine kinase